MAPCNPRRNCRACIACRSRYGFTADATFLNSGLAPQAARAACENAVRYSHRSLVKTIGRIFGLPELASVKGASDTADLFGALP